MNKSFKILKIFVSNIGIGVYQGEVNENEQNESLNYAHKDIIIDPALKRPQYVCQNAYEAVEMAFELQKYT